MRTKKWAIPELNSTHYYLKSPDDIVCPIKNLYKTPAPIHLEIGCGKGLFTARVAAQNKNINYFAVDLSTDILGVAKRNIDKEFSLVGRSVDNILLMRYNAEQIEDIFSVEDNVDRVYILFCNPWPRRRHNKRRLTYPSQLNSYKNFLHKGSTIFFKTDDKPLFCDSRKYFTDCGFKIVRETHNLREESYTDESKILTEHEILFSNAGKNIYFLEVVL